MKDVVHSQCKPLGEVTDYFWRKEFASRGAIHVHWFAYIKDAPVYGESSNTEIALFYDKMRHSLEFIGGNFCQFLFVLVFSLFKCVS